MLRKYMQNIRGRQSSSGMRCGYNKNTQISYSLLTTTLQEEHFNWNLNFDTLLMANLLNSNSAYYYAFKNLSMIAYIIEIHNIANI